MYIEHADWDTWIKPAMFSYNTSIHSAHNYSPHELVFGCKAKIPTEFSDKTIGKTYNDYIDELMRKLNVTQSEARARLIEAKNKSKFYYDQKLNFRDFKAGDMIYMIKDKRENKLDDHYLGPYKLIELIGEKYARIMISKGNEKVVHLDKLKLAYLPY